MPRLRKRRISGEQEKDIVTGFIVSTEFCEEIAGIFRPEYLTAKFARIVCVWSLEYYEGYNEAPKMHIQNIFNIEKPNLKDVVATSIENFLFELSERFEEMEDFNVDYLVDRTKEYFRTQSYYLMLAKGKKLLDAGRVDEVESLFENFQIMKINGDSDLKARLEATMVHSNEFIQENIEKPPRMISPWLTHRSLSMIYGPRGLGKTWLVLIISFSVTRKDGIGLEIGHWRIEDTGGVLFVDGEMDESILHERAKMLTEALGEESDEHRLAFLSAHRHSKKHRKSEMNLSNVKFREEIYRILDENNKFILVLDNISSLTHGLDENSKKDWDPINQWLISLRHLGVAVIYVHHSGKNPKIQRGTSGREDVLDCIINLEKPKNWEQEAGAYFSVGFDKSRVMSPSDDLRKFSLKVLDKVNSDGKLWIASGQAEQDINTLIIKGLLLQGRHKQKDIAKMTGRSEPRITQIKTALIEESLLNIKGKATKKGKQLLKSIKDDGHLEGFEEDSSDISFGLSEGVDKKNRRPINSTEDDRLETDKGDSLRKPIAIKRPIKKPENNS